MNTDVPLSQDPQVQAVVFIGADAVSMMIAESSEAGVRVLDVLSQPVELAKDVFSGGIIRRETMDRCVHIINGYETEGIWRKHHSALARQQCVDEYPVHGCCHESPAQLLWFAFGGHG